MTRSTVPLYAVRKGTAQVKSPCNRRASSLWHKCSTHRLALAMRIETGATGHALREGVQSAIRPISFALWSPFDPGGQQSQPFPLHVAHNGGNNDKATRRG